MASVCHDPGNGEWERAAQLLLLASGSLIGELKLMAGTLANSVAVVTGAGRGIGRAIAMGLAREGAAVGLFARSTEQLEQTARAIMDAGGRALTVTVDVKNGSAVRAGVSEVTAKLGPVSLLINNAGTPGPKGPDWEVDADDWFECIDVSVRGALLLCQSVVPEMITRKAGCIINLASVTGTRAYPPITATSVAKTALIRFSEGLAAQLKEHQVAVFAVHPGVVRTRLLESYNLLIPDDRFSSPERVTELCVRLASGRFNALSGCFIGIESDPEELLRRASGDFLKLRIAS
jgi:NAD(P)-dependent dehydrogenase (short-subunit alcohol dehydrogenase family)